jgi:hypothetical protein
MDLEILEALALATDRTEALGQLLPGSEDHDYFRGLHAQHRGAFDEAQTVLDGWVGRHGHTERYERLRLRQLFYRLEDPSSLEQLRDQFGVDHSHEAEVADVDPTRPTRLAPRAFDGAKLLAEAVSYASDLSQVTDEGLYELIGQKSLGSSERRALLSRITHTARPEVIDTIAADLSPNSFGDRLAHRYLTLDQLHALAARKPELHTNRTFIELVIQRMRPPASVDLEGDMAAREAYLRELWAFVAPLPPATNTLKAHVLWHLLDTVRRRDVLPDATLMETYLQLPREASYVARKLIEQTRRELVVQLGADQRQITGLPPAGNDEALVRDLLQRTLAATGNTELFAPWVERDWLDVETATAQLLLGMGDAERATRVLGPSAAAALRERVELQWCMHNVKRFAVAEPIVLDADVKHVPELLVKVFRIDPLAYFQIHRREVGTDLDLDGLAASHEQVLRFTEPPIRRVRRRIELPMCARAGTYVVDLIGNGIASRALITKGRLRYVSRVAAPGLVVTILDEAGRVRSDARAWIGDREYTADGQGTFVVPFSTSPGRVPALLMAGDIATVTTLELVRENYALALDLALDRQALVDGGTARAVARLRLTVADAPVSLLLLEQATWHVTLTDRAGVATTKSFPLAVSDDGAALLEWPLGEAVAQVDVSMTAKVKVLSEQREIDVAQHASASVATMHGDIATEALFLARTSAGWVLYALGKTGEPRAHRPVTVQLTHRWTRMHIDVELATDANGRCELGDLPGASQITVTLGDHTQTWNLLDPDRPTTIHARSIEAPPPSRGVVIALPPSRDGNEVLRQLSLVELRDNVPVRHPRAHIEATSGALVIRDLPPGDYALRAPGIAATIRVAEAGPEIAGSVVTPSAIIELTRPTPVILDVVLGAATTSGGATSAGTTDDMLLVRVHAASPRTRVHLIATRFLAAPVAPFARGQSVHYRFDRPAGASYVSGRELGDEYRYVLERRHAKRFPSVLADKPSLLLNPWSRRSTSTAVQAAASGRAFAAAPAPSAAPGYYGAAVAGAAPRDEDAYVGYDFLPAPPVVIANLVPQDGVVRVPLAELGDATCVTVIAEDVNGSHVRQTFLRETPLAPRDLRLRLALDAERHATQQKAITRVVPGASIVIEDLATAKVHLLDSVERAHAYLLGLRDDATLREFAFVTKWHALADSERRELYSKYASHELHLFLYCKDRLFFDAVIRPYLANKRTKTFLDHWLLDADLSPYLEPAMLARLNAVERALFAQRVRAEPALARQLADQVQIIPPDPARDTRLIDALLGASALDGDEQMKGFAADALALAEVAAAPMQAMAFAPPGGAAPPPAPKSAPGKAKKRAMRREAEDADEADEEYRDDLTRDLARRRDAAPPMFRAADKTQEWAENNWWHKTPAESGAAMIAPNRLWRDLALHDQGAFLSPSLGLATTSFAEAMCALAVCDLPFLAGQHAYVPDGPRLTITSASNALLGSSQIVDGELVTSGPPLVVGQSYVRTDDRQQWVDGEQVDKYVEGAFLAGVVYTCQVVIANPSSSRQRIAALVQIPRGSMPLAGARPTQTLDISLDAYGTHGHEYSFYFPAPGQYSHFPVHVSRGSVIVAAAPGRVLEVVAEATHHDPTSWPHVSQRGSLADVVAFLGRANLAELDLDLVAWRMRDRGSYDAILGALEARRTYSESLWGYALYHRDLARVHVWARSLGDRLLGAGPVLEMLGLDGEALGSYEHLEYAPLTNARAHRLGGRLRILNDGLAAQYQRFLELVAHRPAPTSEDVLAAVMYLFAQDRNDAALALLSRVGAVVDRMQYDYVIAYASCVTGDVARARDITGRYRELPVDRWRRKFEAISQLLTDAPQVVDPKNREQQQSELAAKQPTFELAVDRDGVIIHQHHVAVLELRFFEMDVELLFSRQPFVQSDVSRFSFIEPGHREQLTNLAAEQRVPWPKPLRGKNVVVEAVGAGMRRSRIHYANDLAANVAQQYGQVRVQRASDRGPLAATYVKVYAKQQNGTVTFYKDGYTDLRGWFDYATLSTDDLDRVERFAILVASDTAGSAILEAAPPMR